jgi:hypothetical protein
MMHQGQEGKKDDRSDQQNGHAILERKLLEGPNPEPHQLPHGQQNKIAQRESEPVHQEHPVKLARLWNLIKSRSE